ncbi:hypothetical protein Syun_004556 [Stephania yunnanensis]|uniref:Uncharacterized protein n=1 Tax=Stephania yunnanensis TaxID=152371 RepID=A0AAP0L6J5_9MAGN
MARAEKEMVKLLLFSSISLPLLCLLLCVATVACRSNVRYLPGFPGPLPFELETGYIGADEKNDVQLFYYFIKSERDPTKDPLVIWLTGGPGCSALSGLLYEIGPLKFKKIEYNGTLPTLELNPHSWTKVSNIIFLDAPVGTGFSYSKSTRGWQSGDIKSATQIYTFLRKWLIEHPEFLSNPFYVCGDSYSGISIPVITLQISDGNNAGVQPVINLKGYAIGNPVTDRRFEYENSRVPFAHGMGLISDELYELAKKSCGGEYNNVDPNNTECHKALQGFYKCTWAVYIVNIMEPNCYLTITKPKEIAGQRRLLNDNSTQFMLSPPPNYPFDCRDYNYSYSYYWANDDEVRKALNIRKGTIEEWIRCNYGLPYTQDVPSSLKYHQSLSERGYRSLIYSGDRDLNIPFIGTEAWIKSLNYSIVDDWRPWFVDRQVAGYTRTYANNMTFATVKGGGHTAPEFKPKECFAMFERWASHNPI